MRALFFSNTISPYNALLVDALRRRGNHVRAIYEHLPADLGRSWIRELSEGDHVASNFAHQYHAAAEGDFDVALLHGTYIGKLAVARMAGLHRAGLFQANRLPAAYWGERLRRQDHLIGLYRNAYFSYCDTIFAIGRWAVKSYTTCVRPGTVIHNFPYTTATTLVPRELAETPTIGFIGSMIPRKGVDRLLRAVANIQTSRRPRLELVGSGPRRSELESLACGLGLEVEWFGELGRQDMDLVRSRWWVQAVPSVYDGWGVVVPEGLASGIPVVASDHTGAALDLIRPGFNGTVLPLDGDWAQAIQGYCDEGTTIFEGQNARLLAAEIDTTKAALWLEEMLDPGARGRSRSFVGEAWGRIAKDIRLPPEVKITPS